MTQLKFLPSSIYDTLDCQLYTDLVRLKKFDAYRELTEMGYDLDENPDGRLLIGVPAGHDRVFTVGPYTITIED